MNRKRLPTVGEASKTIARGLLSPSLFGRLIFDNREKDLPPTEWLRVTLQLCFDRLNNFVLQ